jgi:hypothetical protein
MEKVNFLKAVKGINTYKNVIDIGFSELITPTPIIETNPITVADFFTYYTQLFYDIPVSGDNSHTTLVERSTQYIGGNAQDQEKVALIEEINSLRQQIIDLTQTFSNINDITA